MEEMGEKSGGGGKEGGGGRRNKDVTMLRIDHSDVYIENERLNEDLVQTIDTIHRSRYQRVMSRDSEINELKQSLLVMRQKNNRGSSVLKRPKTQSSGMRPRLKSNTSAASQSKGTKTPTKNNNNKKEGGRSSATPNRCKSIEVRMPQAQINGNHKNDDEDDDDEESVDDETIFSSSCSDDDDDDDEEGSHRESYRGSKSNKGDNNYLITNSNFPKAPSTPKLTRAVQSPHGSSRNPRANHIKRTDLLTRLMSRLNLDKLPPSWYTDVVPASDVNVTKLAFTESEKAKVYHNNHQNRDLTPSKSRRRVAPSVRPSTSAGDMFRQDSQFPLQRRQRHEFQQERPFTSMGLVTWGGGGREQNGRKSRTKMDKNSSGDRETDRSHTVLFCEQSMSSKTMRQLKEEEMQASIVSEHRTVDILLREAKVEQKAIEEKVKLFVKSLDERKRSERLKRLMSESNIMTPHNNIVPWETG